MRLLLDTHIVLWVTMSSPRLPVEARRLIAQADAVFVSPASVWEIAIKAAVRKFDADVEVVVAGLLQAGFDELPISWQHSRLVRELPLHHRDPFDRMLIAQAVAEPLHLLTSDRLLTRYGPLVVLV
jgi:PIN domain nuclease of toxin-antitoxin system